MRKKGKLNKKRIYTTFTVLFVLMFSTILGITVLYNLSKPLEIFFSPVDILSGSQYINDTYIFSDNPTGGWPSETILFVGTADTYEFKSLFFFDISAIDSGDYILNAKLNISAVGGGCSAKINISRITSDWNQDYTTWRNRDNAITWTTPGGDNDLVIANSFVISSAKEYSIDITTLVNYWHKNPEENFGLIMYPGDNSQCIADIDSTEGTIAPKLSIEHVSSQPPTIGTILTDAQTAATPKSVGENVTFTVNWSDVDNGDTKLFICNTSQISPDSCTGKTYCSSSNQPDPATCQYTVTDSDIKASKFYAGVCDSESCNISEEKTFYINHPPNIQVIVPNIDETINVGTTSYLIKFNVSDKNNDNMIAEIYFGPITNPQQVLINGTLSLDDTLCTDQDADKSTPNNCTYDWDPTGFWIDDVYITIYVDDNYYISNDSSDEHIDIHTLFDPFDPNIANPLMPSTFFSGEDITINVSASDQGSALKRVWISINTTSTTITDLTLYEGDLLDGNFSAIFTAVNPGNYTLIAHAEDNRGNLASSSGVPFEILTPTVTINKATSATSTLPYDVIRISGDIQSATSLKGVSAMLNVPDGFLFLSETPQYQVLGNSSDNEQLISNWFLSTPIQEGDYTLNITYRDQYLNNWTTEDITIQVTSSIGGGASVSTIELVGYPVVALDNDYFAEIYFKKSGVLSNANKVEATLYNPQQQIAFGPFTVTDNPSTGKYNFTRTLTTMTGQWELFINITDNLNYYYANQFFTLISGIFDVRSIQIVNPKVNALDISFEAFNKGDIATDLWVFWNLTDSNGNPISGVETSGDETIGVDPGQVITWHIYPKTDYIGQAKITILGKYGTSWDKEAGASKTFTIQPSGTTSPSDGGSPGGGSGDGQASTTSEENKTTTPDEATGDTPQEEEITSDETPEKETPLSSVTQPKYWIWIIILLAFLIIILLVIIVLIYNLYRKQNILNFFEKESKTIIAPQSKNIDFNKRIQDIQNKLK